MADLKPCPFCGCKSIRLNAFGFSQWSAECLSCHVETSRYAGSNAVKFEGEVMQLGRKEAIRAWNKRVGGQQLDKTTCQDCGTVFYAPPKRHFCNNCLKLRQSERAKAMNLNKIGVDAHVAKTSGRRAEDGE